MSKRQYCLIHLINTSGFEIVHRSNVETNDDTLQLEWTDSFGLNFSGVLLCEGSKDQLKAEMKKRKLPGAPIIVGKIFNFIF
jgi:hypothetical protein